MTDDSERKYRFEWALLGDMELGRPNLGLNTRVEIYRLLQFCMRDVLELRVGAEETDRIFHQAGHLAGSQFYLRYIAPVEGAEALIKKVQYMLKEFGIGIFRLEKADLKAPSLIFTISEDLDCSGLPETGAESCSYEEGFIAGILESYFGKKFDVKELDCWCTGDRTCRFSAQPCAR